MAQEPFRRTASELSEAMARGELSARDATRSHLERIESVDPGIRAFVTVFGDRAMEDAARLDEERSRGRVRSPLHGVPVSLKECIDVAGLPTTLGVASRRDRVAAQDAAIVTLLREAGAVVLGRTNNPQLLISYETSNPLHGRTRNPFDPERSPGGSSGGESAAIAAGMSPLGVGTDLGGSLRIPAHCAGVTGFKPTLDRLPFAGCHTALLGQEGVRSTVGPMARTTADLALFLRALPPERMSELDPRVPPLPWREPRALAGLRVGRFEGSPFVAPSAAVLRALDEACAYLRDAGCDVVPFEIPEAARIVAHQGASLGADGGQVLRGALRGSEIEPALAGTYRSFRMPRLVRAAFTRVLERTGDGEMAQALRFLGRRTVPQLWDLTVAIRELRLRFLATMRDARLDLLVGPPFATPAVPHAASRDFILAGAPSSLFSCLQLPAGVVPITRVRPGEERTQRPRSRLATIANRIDRGSAGLPVGAQIVGRPWEEPLVLAAMAAVEARARGAAEFPSTPVDRGG